MSDERWSITITPIPKSEDCIIKTSDGQEWTVKGLAIFADGGDSNLFSFTWNSPVVAARGCIRALSAAFSQGNEFVLQFYRCLFKQLSLTTGAERKMVEPEELLKRWEDEDAAHVCKCAEEKKKWN